MEDELIKFSTAQLAKEKGFTYELCGQSFRPNGDFTYGRNDDIFYPAPTQSLLQRWLREKHKIFVYVNPVDSWHEYKYIVLCEDVMAPFYLYENSEVNSKTYNTYEESLEQGLFESLKLIKV